jgi:hypothetical protein
VAGGETAPDIAAADDEGEFDAGSAGIRDLGGDFLDDFGADAVAAAGLPEDFAAEFEDNPFVAELGRLGHAGSGIKPHQGASEKDK